MYCCTCVVSLASQTMDIHGWGPEEDRSPELTCAAPSYCTVHSVAVIIGMHGCTGTCISNNIACTSSIYEITFLACDILLLVPYRLESIVFIDRQDKVS